MTKWEYISKISACGDRYGNNGGIFDLLRWCGKTNTLEVTEEEARERVSESLTVLSARLALIPKTAMTETLCYEFKTTLGDAEFIVYINAVTGDEEEIFEILNSDEGQLVV